jgi:histidine triad (HIT) family protein
MEAGSDAMKDCIFCDILVGREPASFVYRDDRCAVFMDLRPVNTGHVLVIPNDHAAFLAELDPAVGGYLFAVGQRIAQALRDSDVRCEGINLFLADGAVAGQEVMHVHLHVIPRYRGDGFGLRFGPDYGRTLPRQELDTTAAQIRAHL